MGDLLRNHDELTLEMVTAEERDYCGRTYAVDSRARINLGIRRRLARCWTMIGAKIELDERTPPVDGRARRSSTMAMNSAWGDNYFLGDATGVRTPMQWSADRNGGFSRAQSAGALSAADHGPGFYGFQAVNVEAQQNEASSLLNWTRAHDPGAQAAPAFGRGTLTVLYPHNRKILAYVREHEGGAHPVWSSISRAPPGGRARSIGLSRCRGPSSLSAMPPSRRSATCLTC